MSHHVLEERETDPGITLSESKRVSAPAKVWIALGVLLAGGVAAWVRAEMKGDVTVGRVDKIETEQRAQSVEQRAQRDILIRIDARTAEMQRQLDRGSR